MRHLVSGAATALSEFVGLPTHQYGDCGEDATLMALHALWPAKYPLTPAGLGSLDSYEESHGYADPGGAQSIISISSYLQAQNIAHTLYSWDTATQSRIEEVLHAQLKFFVDQLSDDPVIVEYSAAGQGFPDDEAGVQFHFNVLLGEDDSAAASGGYIGGYLRGDGDSRLDSPTGATTPLILTPWAEIERAQPIAFIVIHYQQPKPENYDHIVHGPIVVR